MIVVLRKRKNEPQLFADAATPAISHFATGHIMVRDNTDKKRFELQLGDQIAFVEYIRAKDAIYLTHTEVPKSLEGQGVGSKLVKEVLGIVKTEGLSMAPLCPFVAAYIKRHPEWKEILAAGYNV